MYDQTRYIPAGDKGLLVEYGSVISRKINKKIRALSLAIESAGMEGISEYVPTYRSVLIYYDPLIWTFDGLVSRLRALEAELDAINLPQPRLYELPVAYGGEYGPDLPFVCQNAGLTPKEVITIHSGSDYLIYMLGFTPGFPYLGEMDERLAAPRLESPRVRIPAGSVGIAGPQTGIYPVESPGGWRLIGRTPARLFDPQRKEPVLLNAGDYVRFIPIEHEEFLRIAREVEEGTYQVTIRTYRGGGH